MTDKSNVVAPLKQPKGTVADPLRRDTPEQWDSNWEAIRTEHLIDKKLDTDRRNRRARWVSITTALRQWCEERKLPNDHGWYHFGQVADHARLAHKGMSLDEEQREAINMAALLHDVDDPKIASFVHMEKELHDAKMMEGFYPIARWWMIRYKLSDRTMALAIEMIGYVSASKNGDTVPAAAKTDPWKLIPRAADRLEALGWTGIRRCHEVTLRLKNPIVTPQTPLPVTMEELDAVLKTKSLVLYNGKSASMIDHIYDKILLMTCPLPEQYVYVNEQWSQFQWVIRNWVLKMNSALKMLVITAPIFGTGHLPRFE